MYWVDIFDLVGSTVSLTGYYSYPDRFASAPGGLKTHKMLFIRRLIDFLFQRTSADVGQGHLGYHSNTKRVFLVSVFALLRHKWTKGQTEVLLYIYR